MRKKISKVKKSAVKLDLEVAVCESDSIWIVSLPI